jgi:hypothetical protein
VGTQALAIGNSSSSHDINAPAPPSARAIMSGRIKKPPRRLYIAWRSINGRLLLTVLSIQVQCSNRAYKEEREAMSAHQFDTRYSTETL